MAAASTWRLRSPPKCCRSVCFETRRLVGAAVGIIGLIATWRIGRRLGGPTAGLVALVLLATCPLYYGHMFMNAKDAPFAAAMAVLLLGMVRAFEEYPRPIRAPSRSQASASGLPLVHAFSPASPRPVHLPPCCSS